MARRAFLAVLLGAAAVLVAVSPARGEGGIYVVMSTGDGAGSCAPFSSFPGAFSCSSLRGAVAAADANPGADVIVLQNAGTYAVTQGPIALTTDITLVGQSARSTILRSNGSGRVLTVAAGVTAGLSALTLSGGNAGGGDGGDVSNAGSLSLALTRVTGGRAANGGGIANAGTLILTNSLVDGNTATGAGGGIVSAGSLFVDDSTIFGNQAGSAGAIASPVADQSLTLSHATIASNTSGATPGGVSAAGSWTSQGSLLAANRGDGVLSNCSIPASTGNPGNMEDGASCGFPGSPVANIGLATALSDHGGHTDVLTIPAGSPAKRFDNPCSAGTDQRLAPRSPGGACDAGAFEEGATAPPISSFAFPVPPPAPVAGKTVVVRAVSGTVRVRVPGTSDFVELAGSQGVPVGSTLDTKHGTVALTARQKPRGGTQTGRFFDGVFKLTQSRKTTNLALTEALAPCRKGKASASAAKKKPKTRRLWGQGSGSFRTSGRYSAATVRGTKWLVQDSCAGTLTRVTQGVVAVRDNVRHKTIVVRAGHTYLAKPRH